MINLLSLYCTVDSLTDWHFLALFHSKGSICDYGMGTKIGLLKVSSDQWSESYKLSKHHSGKGQSQKIILVRLNETVVGFQLVISKWLNNSAALLCKSAGGQWMWFWFLMLLNARSVAWLIQAEVNCWLLLDADHSSLHTGLLLPHALLADVQDVKSYLGSTKLNIMPGSSSKCKSSLLLTCWWLEVAALGELLHQLNYESCSVTTLLHF